MTQKILKGTSKKIIVYHLIIKIPARPGGGIVQTISSEICMSENRPLMAQICAESFDLFSAISASSLGASLRLILPFLKTAR